MTKEAAGEEDVVEEAAEGSKIGEAAMMIDGVVVEEEDSMTEVRPGDSEIFLLFMFCGVKP